LKVANAKRVAVATAYTDTVTDRLKIFLAWSPPRRHGLMNGVRLLGVSPRSAGFGMALAKT
jgi:hypothetical protein